MWSWPCPSLAVLAALPPALPDPGRPLAPLDGFHQASEVTVAKHFPGHGDTDVDSHTGDHPLHPPPVVGDRRAALPGRDPGRRPPGSPRPAAGSGGLSS
ncbi:MAG: glycoside hydrolase family 3 N-terminal domain-containing protein [Streptosporangiaceae bacterium]